MPEFAWINGEEMPLADARVSVEDRGMQFADSVYEVVRIYGGKLFTLRQHLRRLGKSCEGIRLRLPIGEDQLAADIRAFLQRHPLTDGMLYLQVTRGAAPRNHVYPSEARPTVLFYCRALPPTVAASDAPGVKLHSVRDERWQRCWIKSTALLANVLARNEARDHGADEAVFLDDDVVTECSTSNLFMVMDGELISHPLGTKVLPGITRELVLDAARRCGVRFEERRVLIEDALTADEAFITSTTREISWVREWDGRTISQSCGPVTARLHDDLRRAIPVDLG